MYERFMRAIGRTDLIGPEYTGNQKRVPKRKEIEEAIAAWTSQRTPEEVYKAMVEADVPVGRVMNVKDIMENEHLRERGMIERVRVPFRGRGDAQGKKTETISTKDEGWDLDVHRVTPRLESDVPTRWAGPDLGEHNEEVLCGILGLSKTDMDGLQARGVIGTAQGKGI